MAPPLLVSQIWTLLYLFFLWHEALLIARMKVMHPVILRLRFPVAGFLLPGERHLGLEEPIDGLERAFCSL
jgi:hypothetical protein